MTARQNAAAAAADLAACRASMQANNRHFLVASWCLPPRVRDPVTVLYAFCKSLQAMVDEPDPSATAVRDLCDRVGAAYARTTKDSPIDRAFSRVLDEYALPRVIFDAFTEGLSWDAEGRRYATDSGLFDYCVRVAGSLAAAVSVIAGRRKAVVIERAFDLGIAIELTRIARDVGLDTRRGRLYLPIEWLEDAGVDGDAMLEARHATPAIRSVVRRVLQTADSFYLRADPGIGALPFDCRPAVRGVRYVYSAIGHEIERNDYDSITRQAVTSLPRTLRLLARALRSSRSESRPLESRPLREAETLAAAIAMG